jgi:hypothetical protein
MATKKDALTTDSLKGKESPVTPLEEVAEYEVFEDFNGSNDGRLTIEYKVGETVELSASLAAVALAEGWAQPVTAK